MELTNEMKAKIYSLYYGVKCYHYNGWTEGHARAVNSDSIDFVRNGYGDTGSVLILIPLEQISDEDAIEVAKIIKGKDAAPAEFTVEQIDEWPTVRMVRYHDARVAGYIELKFEPFVYCWNGLFKPISYDVYLYLISKSYAVPLWFGIGHLSNGKTAIELGIAITPTDNK